MLYIITFLIILLNIFFGRSKKMLVIDFIFLIILLGWSEGSYDTNIYKFRYIYADNYESFTEPLFSLIINFSNKIGLNYRQFFIISAIFEVYLILKFIYKYTRNFGLVIAAFIISPMITMFVQMRFLLAFVIVLYFGIDKLIAKEKKYVIKYIIAVILATMIHYSSIIYLVFLIADRFSMKKIIAITALAIVCLSSITFFSPILNLARSIVGDEKIDILLIGSTNVDGNFGRIMFILVINLGYLFIYYFYRNLNKDEEELLTQIAKFNVLSLITIPLLLLLSSGFYRINQSLLILNYIGIFNLIQKKKKYVFSKKEIFIITYTFIYAVALFVMMYHTSKIYSLVIYPFFEQNQFFNI